VTSVAGGGAGFDVLQHDGLRSAVRGAVQASSYGQQAAINFESIAGTLYPGGFTHSWQTVPCVENHDIVKVGTDQRIPFLADSADRRSWYARSRSRFATGILLTAPGIPQIFMGQEFLEDKQWSWDPTSSNLLYWDGLNSGTDVAMVNSKVFESDLQPNEPASIAAFFASLPNSEAAAISLILANKELNECVGDVYWARLAAEELQRRRRQLENISRLASDDPLAHQQAIDELKEVLDLESRFTDISRLLSREQ
jgi:hypothetical protein